MINWSNEYLFLKELMNCGITIWQDHSRWVMTKTSSPQDTRNSFPNAKPPWMCKLQFNSFNDAIEFAKEFIEWEIPETATFTSSGEKNQHPPKQRWRVSAMYDQGLGPEYKNLFIEARTPEEADVIGRKSAEALLEKLRIDPETIVETSCIPVRDNNPLL